MNLPLEILKSVEKPARYTGGEINAVYKDVSAVSTRFGFCFPDLYEIAISSLSTQVLYFYINERASCYCERFFAPAKDLEIILRQKNIPLTSLETGTPARDFDILGFTLQYELSYTNIVNMLDLAGIPLFCAERTERDPIILSGGPGALAPEPLADIIDVFYAGEAEAGLYALLDAFEAVKAQKGGRGDVLREMARLPGVYVGAFYEPVRENGLYKGLKPCFAGLPEKIRRQYVKNFDACFCPEKLITPFAEAVFDRVSLEIFRGCARGCRFCHAGFTTRPVREKSVEVLAESARRLIAATGFEEISLLALSAADYSRFPRLAAVLDDMFAQKRVNVCLPSQRADTIASGETSPEIISRLLRGGLTIAPEAGTERLRGVINKQLSDETVLKAAETAFGLGAGRIKLYFMLGLPTETNADIEKIGGLTREILSVFRKTGAGRRPLKLSVGASCFVPKPHTPFQWEAQNSACEFAEKTLILKDAVPKKAAQLSVSNPKQAVVEGALTRGGRRAGGVIVEAWKGGARFDAWSDMFDYAVWERAFAEAGENPLDYLRGAPETDPLPWGHIDTGVKTGFLSAERRRAYEGQITPNCQASCAGCGVCR